MSIKFNWEMNMRQVVVSLSVLTALGLAACEDMYPGASKSVEDAKTAASEAKVSLEETKKIAAATKAHARNAQEAAAHTDRLLSNRACPSANVIADPAKYPRTAPAAMEDMAAWHLKNGRRKGVVTTKSGLQYSVVQKGVSDGPSPVGSQNIRVHYQGYFPNGEPFDSSYQRGKPSEFPANGVIKGWIEGLGMMKVCDAWTLYVPGDLAYGPNGRDPIPPNATLIFNVQLLEIKN